MNSASRARALVDRAQAVLPADVFAWYAGGSGDEITLREQEAAWGNVRLRPRILNDVARVSIITCLLGQSVRSPVLVAPTALHLLAHPDGEVATAAGSREAGCRFVLSMRSSRRLEDVAAAADGFWQQIYVLRDRGVSDDIARLAAASGASALVVTVDTPVVASKHAPFPTPLPATGLVPDLDGRDLKDERYQQASDLTEADLSRLREVSGLPIVAKGVLRVDGARRCADAGVGAVVVSTHGGRQLDRAISVPRALPDVVAAVGDQIEVYADGGIRTGTDVLCAMALGARAVLVGRPVLWGVAVGGSAGVRDVLDELNDDLREALALAGCASVEDVGSDLADRADTPPPASYMRNEPDGQSG